MMFQNEVFKYLALASGLFEMLCFSGVLYGLNSLYGTLRKEKLFAEHCNNTFNLSNSTNKTSGFCAVQNTYFGYILITTMISQCVLAFLFGYLFDKCGQKISKIFVSITFFLACMFFAISFSVSSYLVFISAFLFGISGQILLFCNFSLGKLIPKFQNIIVSIFSGSFDTSSMILTFFALSHNLGVRLCTSFLSLGFLGFFLMICNAFFILSRVENNDRNNEENTTNHIENDITQNPLLTTNENNEINRTNDTDSFSLQPIVVQENNHHILVENNHTNTANIKRDLMEELQDYTNQLYPDFKSIFFSRYYLFQLGFFTILYFRFTYFLVQLNLQLQHNFSNQPELVGTLLSGLNYFFLCGIVFSLLAGIIVDLFKRHRFKSLLNSKQTNHELYTKTMQCFFVSQMICCICNFIVSITIIIPSVAAVYVTYLCATITRAFLFSLNSAYLLQAFPVKFFGKTLGITSFFAGVVSFIQYALLFKDLYKLNIVNYILIALSCLNFSHPLILIFKK